MASIQVYGFVIKLKQNNYYEKKTSFDNIVVIMWMCNISFHTVQYEFIAYFTYKYCPSSSTSMSLKFMFYIIHAYAHTIIYCLFVQRAVEVVQVKYNIHNIHNITHVFKYNIFCYVVIVVFLPIINIAVIRHIRSYNINAILFEVMLLYI